MNELHMFCDIRYVACQTIFSIIKLLCGICYSVRKKENNNGYILYPTVNDGPFSVQICSCIKTIMFNQVFPDIGIKFYVLQYYFSNSMYCS